MINYYGMYLEFLGTGVADSTHTNVAVLKCYVHGEIEYYTYNEVLPLDAIMKTVEDHRRVMHVGQGI